MMTQLRYAAQATRWMPLAAVFATALAIGGALSFSDGGVTTHLVIGVIGAIAAAVALSLDDPAHALLSAVPVGTRRRVATRVALVGPVSVAAWRLLDALEEWVFNTPIEGVGVRALLALTIVGVAITLVAQDRNLDRAATIGASVAVGWALSFILAPEGTLADLSTAWINHPGTVLALGVLVIMFTPNAMRGRGRVWSGLDGPITSDNESRDRRGPG